MVVHDFVMRMSWWFMCLHIMVVHLSTCHHVFTCHGGSCVDMYGGSCFSCFFNMSWWFMFFQHVMVVHVFLHVMFLHVMVVHVFYMSWWFMSSYICLGGQGFGWMGE